MPLVDVLFKHGEYVRGFDVPQSLIGLPCLHIFFCGIKLLFEGGIAEVETVLVHLKDQVLIGLVTLCSLVLLALAKLLIPMCVDSLQTANYFELLVESLVPEGTGFGNGRVQHNGLVRDFDFKHCLVVDQFSAKFGILVEFIDPNLHIVFEALNQDGTDTFIEILNPVNQIAIVVKVEVIENSLDQIQLLLHYLSHYWTCCQLSEVIFDKLSLFNGILNGFLVFFDCNLDLLRETLDLYVSLPLDL